MPSLPGSALLRPDSLLASFVDELPPRLVLASLPTPVEALPWIEGGSVWIKRDDQSSSLYGGGKVRKLEWILGDGDRRPVLSLGATAGVTIFWPWRSI